MQCAEITDDDGLESATAATVAVGRILVVLQVGVSGLGVGSALFQPQLYGNQKEA